MGREVPYSSSSNLALTSCSSATTAASASAPSASISMQQPGRAASIIRPMIERASTVWPSLETRTSASKPEAVFTNLAEARACRPRLLMISTVRDAPPFTSRRSLLAGQDIGGDGDVLAPGFLGARDRVLQALARADARKLDQHGQVEAGD